MAQKETIMIINEYGKNVAKIITKKARIGNILNKRTEYSWSLYAMNGNYLCGGKGFNTEQNMNKSLRAVKRAFRYLKADHIE